VETCEECPAGKFAALVGKGNCVFCPEGKFNTQNASGTCESCPVGRFAIDGSTGCSDCPVGKFQNGTESGACESCDAGSYAEWSGATSCKHCPAGTFQALQEYGLCDCCEGGTYSPLGVAGCFGCPAGSFSGTCSGVDTCTLCPHGKFSSVGTSCTDCDAGSYSDHGASQCTACPSGKYALAGKFECYWVPVHCAYDWSDWSDCTRSCGTGTHTRHAIASTVPAHGGDACPPNETAYCNKFVCSEAPTASPSPHPTPVPTPQVTAAPGAPVLTVHGLDVQVLQANLSHYYVDEGASCADLTLLEHGEPDLWSEGSVFPDISAVGVYEIEFHCQSSNGQVATPLTRTITVEDKTCPVCEVTGADTVVVEASFPYVDSGALCHDDMGGNVTMDVQNSVNVEEVGEYTVVYRALDEHGNWNDADTCRFSAQSYTRTITVVDTLKPVIGLQYKGTHLIEHHNGLPPASSDRRLQQEFPASSVGEGATRASAAAAALAAALGGVALLALRRRGATVVDTPV
jgi:hypothetical protein